MPNIHRVDFLVVGSGIAGLATALKASRYGRVLIITKAGLLESNTRYAQGGIAAAMAPGDTPRDHLADTLRAGHDLVSTEAATVLVEDGPLRVKELIELGARFDASPDGSLVFGREAAHSKNRILHARGDATGMEVAEVLAAQVKESPAIDVLEQVFALDLIVHEGRCLGLTARLASGETLAVLAHATVLATGGCGRVYKYTTNPSVATGDGMAMAARAGVPIVDMEFVQFHPTALDRDDDPMFLISEAVRGEGARLINDAGEAFMKGRHPQADLAPRDVVARAIFQQMQEGRRVYLDASSIGARFSERFPTIYHACLERGLNPPHEPIPIAPAAHFVMGGIRTDTDGRTGLKSLFACGEVACTGVHGANRLASNSLLEGLVFAERIARSIAQELSSSLPGQAVIDELSLADAASLTAEEAKVSDRLTEALRQVMWDYAGIVRSSQGLEKAARELEKIKSEAPPHAYTLRNMIETGRLIVHSALERRESRGGHFREDFPAPDPSWQERRVVI